jgi:dTMP kinase
VTTSAARLIAFEGGEACGKSTQAARLAGRLGALLTREPGGTWLGEHLRTLLLDHTGDIDGRAEALLMAAARAQHVAEVIGPALGAGRHVVTDRFTGSSLAYQGVGRGLGVTEVASLSTFATGGLEPDLTVLLEVPSATAAARLAARPRGDRIEAAGAEFHEAVTAAYQALAAADDRWVAVDAGGTVEEVEDVIWRLVRDRLQLVAARG